MGGDRLRKDRLLRNTALLSGSTLLMSLIGLAFQAWLSARIGAAGLGLYQLVCSVTALGATFAISGIRFASTRLVAAELGAARGEGVPAAMRPTTGMSTTSARESSGRRQPLASSTPGTSDIRMKYSALSAPANAPAE